MNTRPAKEANPDQVAYDPREVGQECIIKSTYPSNFKFCLLPSQRYDLCLGEPGDADTHFFKSNLNGIALEQCSGTIQCLSMMLSQKTRGEFARCVQQSSTHPSRWNNAWLQLCFDLFVEAQTSGWYSLQLWPRAKHDMDTQRTPALTVMRHNIDLNAAGSSSNTSDAGPISDVQSAVIVDYLDSPSWNDTNAISILERHIRSQTAHILGMHPGEYGYGRKAVYFILAVGQSWRFGVRDPEGFRYLCNWHGSTDGLEARRDLQRLVGLVDGL